MKKLNEKNISPAKEIAAVAVMCALLIGGQLVLSSVSGVEVVTVLLLSFSFTFGRRAGVLAAIAFSILRCFLWGFFPSVILLYLIYYPLFALAFGALGGVKQETYEKFPVYAAIIVDFVLIAVSAASAFCAATDFLKISRLAVTMIKTLLWLVFALTSALFIAFNVLFVMQRRGRLKSKSTLVVAVVTATATLFTICFTLLDDVITPLIMGWGLFSETTVTYFYTSFLSLAPQTVCTIVSVSVLFLPLTSMFKKAHNV